MEEIIKFMKGLDNLLEFEISISGTDSPIEDARLFCIKKSGLMLGYKPVEVKDNFVKFNVKDIENIIKVNEEFGVNLEVFIKDRRFVPFECKGILIEPVKVEAKKVSIFQDTPIKVEAKMKTEKETINVRKSSKMRYLESLKKEAEEVFPLIKRYLENDKKVVKLSEIEFLSSKYNIKPELITFIVRAIMNKQTDRECEEKYGSWINRDEFFKIAFLKKSKVEIYDECNDRKVRGVISSILTNSIVINTESGEKVEILKSCVPEWDLIYF